MNKAYKYGVEIECIVNRDDTEKLADYANNLGIKAETDSSIHVNDSSYEVGREYKLGALSYRKMVRSLSKFTKKLNNYDVTVNSSCGLHVHMSNKRFFMRKNLIKIIHTWAAIEDVFFSTQPKSRYNNNYCVRFLGEYIQSTRLENIPTKKEEVICTFNSMSRYYALNISSLGKHGTIEVRLHSATTDKHKIIYLINLLRAFFNYCLLSYDKKEIAELFSTTIDDNKVKKVWKLLRLDKKTKKHFAGRVKKFEFDTLARQQKAAIDYLALKPKLRRVQTKYNELSNELDTLNRTARRYTSSFRNC